jgi:hypothetical protein
MICLRIAGSILALAFLAGCVTPDSHEPQAFRYNGKQYVALYMVNLVDSVESGSDGSEMRVYSSAPLVAVSRADGTQFAETDADRNEAETVAVAYCVKLDFIVDTKSQRQSYFTAKIRDDNSEWMFSSLCRQPDKSDETSR